MSKEKGSNLSTEVVTSDPSCGTGAVIIFVLALIAGTASSLTAKIMLSMKSVGMTGEIENFSFPLFQTFGMFSGMLAALVMHFVVIYFRIPFPGYSHKSLDGKYVSITGEITEDLAEIPMWMYFFLIIPSLFDLVATAFCMFGLRYVNASIFQILRGSAIIFVAILKHFALGDKQKTFQWIGIVWNVVAIILVGITALLTNASSSEGPTTESGNYDNPLVGVALILTGALVQSLQYAFEEKVMKMDIPAPPLLLVGMEGFWGTLICVCILYPLAFYLPGPDHGCIENYQNTIVMISNSIDIQSIFVLYFFSIFSYNLLACLVTFMLNSVWHAILDNFRPIFVWGVDMFIFYFITASFGEPWSPYCYFQLAGLFVLFYGTAIYNAPNSGSILLDGSWQACFIDCSKEYPSVSPQENSALLDKKEPSTGDLSSPYLHHTSPFLGKRRQSNDFSNNDIYLMESGGRRGISIELQRGNSFATGVKTPVKR